MRTAAFELRNLDGLPLRGDVRCADSGDRLPVVVVCHGFKGFKDWGFFPYLGERLAQAGFLSVSFNFSGSGIGPDLQNFTELDRFAADTVTAQIGDLGRVLDAVVKDEVGAGCADRRHIAVLGHSRGGGTAILTARGDERVRAVVTWAGLSTFERWSEPETRVWRERGYAEFLNARTKQMMRMNTTYLDDLAANSARYDVLRAASELEVPLLVVHGADDASVPASEARALHAAARPGRAELLVLPDTGHTFGAEHPWKGTTPALERAVEHSIAWLRASIAVAREGSVR
jgi:pimeloyl-ACP methyl ester carboxylesterase